MGKNRNWKKIGEIKECAFSGLLTKNLMKQISLGFFFPWEKF